MKAYTRVRNSIQSLQHRSHDHRIPHIKIMRHANGEHLHRDDLTTTPAVRRAVHARVARDEELGEVVHEFARTLWRRGDELQPTRRVALRAGGNTRECRGRATQLSVWGECEGESVECHVPIQLSHSIGRMPIITLLLFFLIAFSTQKKSWWDWCLLVAAWFVRALWTWEDLILCFGDGGHWWVGKGNKSPIYKTETVIFKSCRSLQRGSAAHLQSNDLYSDRRLRNSLSVQYGCGWVSPS